MVSYISPSCRTLAGGLPGLQLFGLLDVDFHIFNISLVQIFVADGQHRLDIPPSEIGGQCESGVSGALRKHEMQLADELRHVKDVDQLMNNVQAMIDNMNRTDIGRHNRANSASTRENKADDLRETEQSIGRNRRGREVVGCHAAKKFTEVVQSFHCSLDLRRSLTLSKPPFSLHPDRLVQYCALLLTLYYLFPSFSPNAFVALHHPLVSVWTKRGGLTVWPRVALEMRVQV